MANVVSFNSYQLHKGASISDFLLATEVLINEFVSKQKGFISSKLLAEGETWADFTVFESLEDLNAFIPLCNKNELARKVYGFINFGTLDSHVYSVEKDFDA